MGDYMHDVELGGHGPTSYPSAAIVEGPSDNQIPSTEQEFYRDDEALEGADETSSASKPHNHLPTIAGALLQCLFLTVLVLTPAAFVYYSSGYERYSFSAVKITSPNTNSWMEFVRWSLFLYIAMVGFLVVEWLVVSLPFQVLQLLKRSNIPVSSKNKRAVTYFVAARYWFTLFFWILFLGAVGANILYRTSLLGSLGRGIFGKAPTPAAAAASKVHPIYDSWFYLERSLLALSVFFICFAVARYLVELITINFHRMAYEDRVTESNYRFSIVAELYGALKHPGKRAKIGKTMRGVHLKDDRYGILKSEKNAVNTAHSIFSKLVIKDREHLTVDDLANFFEPSDLKEAFKIFDKNGNGEVDRAELEAVIMEIYEERKAISMGLKNNHRIIRKLDTVLFAVATFLTSTFSVPIFQVGGAAVFAIFGILWTALGFLLQSTARQCFESMVFVFVEHAYDVGDRVIVDGEYLTVARVEIFTTIFLRWDGAAAYIPNSSLASKNIYNIRRSGMQIDAIDLSLAAGTSVDEIWQLRDRLVQFAESEPKHYSGRVDIAGFSSEEDKCTVQLMVEYRSNFQDAAMQTMRKNKFMAAIEQIASELGIEYFH